MEIIAITAMLATAAVLVLVIRQPWRAPGARLMVLWLFRGYPARHDGTPADTRSAMQRWEDGPGPPPIGSMSAADEQHYRAMTGLPPALAYDAELDYRAQSGQPPSGAELNARLDAQRAAWAEPRPGILLMPGNGPERGPQWPPEPPGPGPEPPPPVERTDGGGEPGGAWRAHYDELAPRPPWEPAPLPAWATEGGNWRIPPGAFSGPMPELDEPSWLGPEPCPRCHQDHKEPFCDDGREWGPYPSEPEREPEAVSWPGAMHWAPSRLASPADRQRAAELADQDVDAALFIDRMALNTTAFLRETRQIMLAARGLA